jgi:hypothetical protein
MFLIFSIFVSNIIFVHIIYRHHLPKFVLSHQLIEAVCNIYSSLLHDIYGVDA